MISNRVTSTSPRSVIFSAGITGRARKASCRNGSSSVTPQRPCGGRAGSPARRAPSSKGGPATSAPPRAGAVRRGCARRGAIRRIRPRSPTAGFRGQRHVGVIDADTGDVVMIVADGARHPPRPEPESPHEARGRCCPVFSRCRFHQPSRSARGRGRGRGVWSPSSMGIGSVRWSVRIWPGRMPMTSVSSRFLRRYGSCRRSHAGRLHRVAPDGVHAARAAIGPGGHRAPGAETRATRQSSTDDSATISRAGPVRRGRGPSARRPQLPIATPRDRPRAAARRGRQGADHVVEMPVLMDVERVHGRRCRGTCRPEVRSVSSGGEGMEVLRHGTLPDQHAHAALELSRAPLRPKVASCSVRMPAAT